MISETTELTYEKKEQTGVIVIREQGDNRKDRYTSVSYLCYFANKLAQDLSSKNEDYDFVKDSNSKLKSWTEGFGLTVSLMYKF